MKTILILILLVLVLTSCKPLLLYQEGTPADSATYRLITEKVRKVKKVKNYSVVITQMGKRMQVSNRYDNSATISFYYKEWLNNYKWGK